MAARQDRTRSDLTRGWKEGELNIMLHPLPVPPVRGNFLFLFSGQAGRSKTSHQRPKKSHQIAIVCPLTSFATLRGLNHEVTLHSSLLRRLSFSPRLFFFTYHHNGCSNRICQGRRCRPEGRRRRPGSPAQRRWSLLPIRARRCHLLLRHPRCPHSR